MFLVYNMCRVEIFIAVPQTLRRMRRGGGRLPGKTSSSTESSGNTKRYFHGSQQGAKSASKGEAKFQVACYLYISEVKLNY